MKLPYSEIEAKVFPNFKGGDCLKTKEFTIRNRHSKISIWDT